MCLPDDISNETPSSQSEGAVGRKGSASHRSIGLESEDRGGPEGVVEALDANRNRSGTTSDRRGR
jgi:hypothetical protein